MAQQFKWHRTNYTSSHYKPMYSLIHNFNEYDNKIYSYIINYPIIDLIYTPLKERLYKYDDNVNSIGDCKCIEWNYKDNIFIEFVNDNYNINNSVTNDKDFIEIMELYVKYTNVSRKKIYEIDLNLRRNSEYNSFINTETYNNILGKRKSALEEYKRKYDKLESLVNRKVYNILYKQYKSLLSHDNETAKQQIKILNINTKNVPYKNIYIYSGFNEINYLFRTYLRNKQTDKITLLGHYDIIDKYKRYRERFTIANMLQIKDMSNNVISPYISWSRELNNIFIKRALLSSNDINIIILSKENNEINQIREPIPDKNISRGVLKGILIIPFKDDRFNINEYGKKIPKHPIEKIILFIFESPLYRNASTGRVCKYKLCNGDKYFTQPGFIFPQKTIVYNELLDLYYMHNITDRTNLSLNIANTWC